jgi:Holliday junction resolvase RusA-like endonuclease
MKIYTFKIIGNQENKKGNPIPYYRTTQRGKFTREYKRYSEWKEYILFDCFGRKKINLKENETAEMNIKIFFSNKKHGDADNVFKGIADAIFENDKYLLKGSFESFYNDVGMVKVEIKIN